MCVARQHLLARRHHLVGRQTGIDAEIFERPVEPVDVLNELERAALKGAGHIERSVTVFEAAVAERDHDLALGHDTSVEVGDALVPRRIAAIVAHATPPNSGARVSANSSTAPTRWSPSASSSAIDSAIMPRLANQMPRAVRSK